MKQFFGGFTQNERFKRKSVYRTTGLETEQSRRMVLTSSAGGVKIGEK